MPPIGVVQPFWRLPFTPLPAVPPSLPTTASGDAATSSGDAPKAVPLVAVASAAAVKASSNDSFPDKDFPDLDAFKDSDDESEGGSDDGDSEGGGAIAALSFDRLLFKDLPNRVKALREKEKAMDVPWKPAFNRKLLPPISPLLAKGTRLSDVVPSAPSELVYVMVAPDSSSSEPHLPRWCIQGRILHRPSSTSFMSKLVNAFSLNRKEDEEAREAKLKAKAEAKAKKAEAKAKKAKSDDDGDSKDDDEEEEGDGDETSSDRSGYDSDEDEKPLPTADDLRRPLSFAVIDVAAEATADTAASGEADKDEDGENLLLPETVLFDGFDPKEEKHLDAVGNWLKKHNKKAAKKVASAIAAGQQPRASALAVLFPTKDISGGHYSGVGDWANAIKSRCEELILDELDVHEKIMTKLLADGDSDSDSDDGKGHKKPPKPSDLSIFIGISHASAAALKAMAQWTPPPPTAAEEEKPVEGAAIAEAAPATEAASPAETDDAAATAPAASASGSALAGVLGLGGVAARLANVRDMARLRLMRSKGASSGTAAAGSDGAEASASAGAASSSSSGGGIGGEAAASSTAAALANLAGGGFSSSVALGIAARPLKPSLPTQIPPTKLLDRLLYVHEVSAALTDGARPFRDDILCAAWAHSIAGTKHIESNHSYRPGEVLKGDIEIAEASITGDDCLKLVFHPRCATLPGHELVLSYVVPAGASASSSGKKPGSVVESRFSGPAVDSNEDDDDDDDEDAGGAKKAGGDDARTKKGNWDKGFTIPPGVTKISYSFSAPSTLTAAETAALPWGIAFTVVGKLSASAKTSLVTKSADEIAFASKLLLSRWNPSMDSDLMELARSICDDLSRSDKDKKKKKKKSEDSSSSSAPAVLRRRSSGDDDESSHGSDTSTESGGSDDDDHHTDDGSDYHGGDDDEGSDYGASKKKSSKANKVKPSAMPLEHLCIRNETEALKYPALADVPPQQLRMRLALIRIFNSALEKSLPCFNLSSKQSWSVGARIRALSSCIFSETKDKLLQSALKATSKDHNNIPTLYLSNFKASESQMTGAISPETSQCMFAQAYLALRSIPGTEFCGLQDREQAKVFEVQFSGESGIDAGGVWREGLSRIMDDLFSDHFDLLVRCPNARRGDKLNADSFVPNPKHRTPLSLSMLEFVGKFMGMSLRAKSALPFCFPALVYKAIVGQKPRFEDLVSIDTPFAQLLDSLRSCETEGIVGGQIRPAITTDSDFAAAYPNLRFTCVSSDGTTEVELIPGGRDIPVTFSNRLRYCESAERFRLHEFDAQLAAIRRGLSTVVPIRALSLFTASELEVLIAGDADINVDVLKAHSSYSGFSESDKIIKWFWQIVRSMTRDERSRLLRFTWGRSRLPAEDRWTNKFTIAKVSGTDKTLPSAHVSSASRPSEVLAALPRPLAHFLSSSLLLRFFLFVLQTCFNTIDISGGITSKASLRRNLLIAIEFGLGGILNS
jgi:HECT-domain (ubiquitin-transferase)